MKTASETNSPGAVTHTPTQEFQKYPDLAGWIGQLANSNIEGMSLSEWNRFLASLNAALKGVRGC